MHQEMVMEELDGVIGGFVNGETQMVVGEVSDFRGRTYAHIRIMVPSAVDPGEWVRTAKGVAIDASRVVELKEAVDKLASVAATERVVARILAGREEIWVGVQRWRGNQYAYVRRFYQTSDGRWLPTQKGVNVRTDRLDDLIELVRQLSEAAAGKGQP